MDLPMCYLNGWNLQNTIVIDMHGGKWKVHAMNQKEWEKQECKRIWLAWRSSLFGQPIYGEMIIVVVLKWSIIEALQEKEQTPT